MNDFHTAMTFAAAWASVAFYVERLPEITVAVGMQA